MSNGTKENKNKMSFTKEQQVCIDERNKNLLISASAGSGKTSTMIERIKTMIINKEVSVQELLVITFTNASASDMRNKLVEGLEKIENKDDFIKEQLLEINLANISTIHSFCSRLIRTYFYEVGLDPSFVLIDEIESNLLKEKALTKLIDDAFVENDEQFIKVYEMLSSKRSEENLRSIILNLHNFITNLVNPDEWFKKSLKDAYTTDFSKNIAIQFLNDYYCKNLLELKQRSAGIIESLKRANQEKLLLYLNQLSMNLDVIKPELNFVQNKENSRKFDEIFPRFPIVKNADEIKEYVKNFCDELKEKVKDARDFYLNFNENFVVQQLDENKKIVDLLYNYVKKFDTLYGDLKKDKVALDFSDLEKFTLKLFANDTIAETVRNRFKYVFVDEYQDINEVQEKLITLVSKDDNLFMVGDVKQSIYRFRGSEPQIFVDKYNYYKTGKSNKNMGLDLNHNFRSHSHILNFCNEIFMRSMTKDFGGVDYINSSMLVKGNKDKQISANLPVVSVNIIDYKPVKNEIDEKYEVYSVKNHIQRQDNINKANLEGVFVAKKIAELVNGDNLIERKNGQRTAINYKDICILSSSVKSEYLDIVLSELTKMGIPFSTDIEDDIFDNYYINVIKCFLQLVENKYQDIPLLAVLQSEMFDFSINDLAIIRKNDRKAKFFYQAFESSVNNELVPQKLKDKVNNFIKFIDDFNFLSKFNSVDKLIKMLLSTTNFDKVILRQADGDSVMFGINSLLNYIANKSYNTNLSKFLDGLKDNTILLNTNTTVDGVLVSTIHKSKGLQYPIVILIGAGRSIDGNRGLDFICSKNLGVAMPYYNSEMHCKYSTINMKACLLEDSIETLKEKLRLLYVALTRAEDYLIIVGVDSSGKQILKRPNNAKCFFDWIMPVVVEKENGGFNLGFKDFVVNRISQNELAFYIGENKNVEYVFGDTNKILYEEIKKVLTFVYPYVKSTEMPVKTSVSELLKEETEGYFVPKAFVYKQDSSSVEKGNAYHNVMEHINLDISSEEACKKAILDMKKGGIITAEEYKLVNYLDIYKLLMSPIMKACATKKILREREFIAISKIPAVKNATDVDSVVLQGIIDFVCLDGDSAIVIDFKTNAWKDKEKYVKFYEKQLDLYANVIAESYKIKKVKKLIYSFYLGEFIELN